jgi:sec-independent protein translocase protein TatC
MKRKTEANDLGFWDHIEDLRRKLFWVFAWFLLCFFLAYFLLSERLIEHLVAGASIEVFYLGVFEPFLIKVRVSLYSSLLVSLPLFVVQLLRFLMPGLYPRERRIVLVFVGLLAVCAGALGWLSYRYSSLLLDFFISTFASEGIKRTFSVTTFLSFYLMLLGIDLLVLVIPLATLALLKTGVLDRRTLAKSRRILVPLFLLISAMITPPDPATMLIVFVPLWFLFEGALFASRLFIR